VDVRIFEFSVQIDDLLLLVVHDEKLGVDVLGGKI